MAVDKPYSLSLEILKALAITAIGCSTYGIAANLLKLFPGISPAFINAHPFVGRLFLFMPFVLFSLMIGVLAAAWIRPRSVLLGISLALVPVLFSWFVLGEVAKQTSYTYTFSHGTWVLVSHASKHIDYSALIKRLVIAGLSGRAGYYLWTSIARRRKGSHIPEAQDD